MPIIRSSTYRPSPLMANGHLQTILPSLLRRVNGVRYRRERIATPDDDFIDLDWSRRGSRHLALLCHGLEGSSRAPYMRGMARALNRAGWDAVAYNYRGCSGTINRQLRAYHSGATESQATHDAHTGSGYVGGCTDCHAHNGPGSPGDAVHDDGTVDTIEGNTNDEGSPEGYEVCSRTRAIPTLDFAFVPEPGAIPEVTVELVPLDTYDELAAVTAIVGSQEAEPMPSLSVGMEATCDVGGAA